MRPSTCSRPTDITSSTISDTARKPSPASSSVSTYSPSPSIPPPISVFSHGAPPSPLAVRHTASSSTCGPSRLMWCLRAGPISCKPSRLPQSDHPDPVGRLASQSATSPHRAQHYETLGPRDAFRIAARLRQCPMLFGKNGPRTKDYLHVIELIGKAQQHVDAAGEGDALQRSAAGEDLIPAGLLRAGEFGPRAEVQCCRTDQKSLPSTDLT